MNRIQNILLISLVWLTVIWCSKEQVEYNWEQVPGKSVLIRSNDLTLLTAENAKYSKDMTINKAVTGIGNWKRTDQWFRWKIQSEKKADYEVTLLFKGKVKDRITVSGPINSVTCAVERDEWNRQTCQGALSLPKGESQIEVRLNNDSEASLFSLELVDVKDREIITQRIQQFRSDTRWLKERTYGIFFQWGFWGYPKEGKPKSNWEDVYRDFNYERWANLMEEMGAGWVVWSITWTGQHLAAPIASYENIHDGFTMEYDFIGKLAEALAYRDIKLIFYYHPGHGEKTWWNAYAGVKDGQPDRNVWFPNFIKVISEIGNRYGDHLHGWMFDGGRKYYPAPYLQLGKAAKAGYPERLVSWNPWILARVTEFQDFYFGEDWHQGRWPTDSKGLFSEGPQQGLHAHGNYPLEHSGWGIKKNNQTIKQPEFTPQEWIDYLGKLKEAGAGISPAVLMYEDGEMYPVTYQLFVHARQKFRGISDKDIITKRRNRGDKPVANSYVWLE